MSPSRGKGRGSRGPGNVVRLPTQDDTRQRPLDLDADPVARTASQPDVLDLRADERDEAADERDVEAEARAKRLPLERLAESDLQEALMMAARDRAAAALDRKEAALDRRRASEYLKRAYRDELTGVLQRGAGQDQLQHEVERAHRNNESLVVAFIDVVHLKQVNDQHGHKAGDEVLRAVSSALLSGLRGYDVLVRYGGDEFVCALPRATLAAAARRFTEVAHLLSAASPGSAISVGLVALAEGESLDEVVRRADIEMYDGRRLLAAIESAVEADSEADSDS